MKLNDLDIISLVLVIVGGINWGLFGALKLDLVASVFGPDSALSNIIYILVGLAAIYLAIISLKLDKK